MAACVRASPRRAGDHVRARSQHRRHRCRAVAGGVCHRAAASVGHDGGNGEGADADDGADGTRLVPHRLGALLFDERVGRERGGLLLADEARRARAAVAAVGAELAQRVLGAEEGVL